MPPTYPPDSEIPGAEPKPASRTFFDEIRSRILSGLLFMLPIVITFWIITWIYETLRGIVLDPLARLVRRLFWFDGIDLPNWWQTYASPISAAILALLILYLLGYFVRTRFSQALDWILLRVPLVAVIYKAVRNLFQSLQSSSGGLTFKRVVLVQFPHPGSRALAFVTKSLTDPSTQEAILCVWVLTGVMPPAGFVLFVKEKEVIDVPWTVNETIQVIVSGGITAPTTIPFHQGSGPSYIIARGQGPVTPG